MEGKEAKEEYEGEEMVGRKAKEKLSRKDRKGKVWKGR